MKESDWQCSQLQLIRQNIINTIVSAVVILKRELVILKVASKGHDA